MEFLTPEEVAAWYCTSLEVSGFVSLDPGIRLLWEETVFHGSSGFPPGLFARLCEALFHHSPGRSIRKEDSPEEDALLMHIRNDAGFTHLEGTFLLARHRPSPEKMRAAIGRIRERLGSFDSAEIRFAQRDLDAALAGNLSPDPVFPARRLLRETALQALERLGHHPFHLSSSDLFEIAHPGLVAHPAARHLFRRMNAALNGISPYAGGIYTLPAEDPEVVSRFGEPHVLPIGGYDTLTNKGDFSSLVPSELAFIEEREPIDLFTHKLVEHQLLFYQRDEGTVFRIRREFVIRQELTPFLEHERHLALFLAFVLTLGQRLFETFAKDAITVRVQGWGEKASNLQHGWNFLGHFLRERALDEHFMVDPVDSADRPASPAPPERAQGWVLARDAVAGWNHLALEFPQTDAFARLSTQHQERFLGDLISGIIETAVRRLGEP